MDTITGTVAGCNRYAAYTKKGEFMYQAGLVLEGGGMKGAYTAGVLDFFMDQKIEFSGVYGVSAGAIHMCSYLSGQRGRSIDIWLKYGADKRYCSIRSLLFTGDLFNVDMCYRLIPEKLNPFDNEAYKRYSGKAYAVVTNIETGKPEYLRVRDGLADIGMVRASASLPLVSRNVEINGKLYLDGGISDAIPIQKSILDGNRKNIVILTKEEGYVRKPSSQLGLIKMRYRKYPQVYELMKNRHTEYNQVMEYLYRQQANGQAFVIRPKKAGDVGRLEKDPKKLEALYQEGYADAEACYEEMIQYLES